MPANYSPKHTLKHTHKDKSSLTALKSLRLALRNRRHQLSSSQQLAAALNIKLHLSRDEQLKCASTIAAYLAEDGEAGLMPTIKWAWQQGKSCFLPVLKFNNAQQEQLAQASMGFNQLSVGTQLNVNRFNIKEPQQTPNIDTGALDIVLVPLVGFNWLGHRLGMGGGFYDRTFSSPNNRPLLLGVAHSCQYHHELVQQPWDVNLDGIVTEKELMWF